MYCCDSCRELSQRKGTICDQGACGDRTLVGGEQHSGTGLVLHLHEIEPGATTTALCHFWEHKVFMLGGGGEAAGEEREIALGKGDVGNVPPAKRHRLFNRGDRVPRLLVVLAFAQHTFLTGE